MIIAIVSQALFHFPFELTSAYLSFDRVDLALPLIFYYYHYTTTSIETNTLRFTMFAKHLLAALLPFYIAAVNAANDWSLPCTSGICEWDTKNEDTTGNVIVVSPFVYWTDKCLISLN